LEVLGEQNCIRSEGSRFFAILSLSILLLIVATGSVQADDGLGGLGVAASDSELNLEAEADEIDDLFALAAVAEDELSEIRGGESTAVSLQDLNSTVEGNSISGNVTTGSVSIGENAFSDLDGISSVIVNSGNNVSIQSSTVINVVIGE